jgi:hypothetical protein
LPQAAPVAPAYPFGFAEPPPAAETLPSVYLNDPGTGSVVPPRRRKKSPVRTWSSLLAILGALLGALLVVLLKVTGQDLIEALGRIFRNASPERLSGAVLGTVHGLFVGGLIVTFAGRNGITFCGMFILMVAGGIFGWFQEVLPLFMGWEILALGGIAGALAGTLVGGLVGVIIGASSSARPRYG